MEVDGAKQVPEDGTARAGEAVDKETVSLLQQS